MQTEREKALLEIQQSINSKGFFTYIVEGGVDPRFAYTIGLSSKLGYELIFAGGAYFSKKDVRYIIDRISQLVTVPVEPNLPINFENDETYLLSKVHPTWCEKMLLGALDYFSVTSLKALQIQPPRTHWTIDIPNLVYGWDPDTEPPWQWLGREDAWKFSLPQNSCALTNIPALQGQKINQIVRWSDTDWDCFVGEGSEVPDNAKRTVPLAMFLALDSTLVDTLLLLQIDQGAWRENGFSAWEIFQVP